MNFWLRSVEDPNPAKKDQYKRWESMRDTMNKKKVVSTH
jgi:hypothetical protein